MQIHQKLCLWIESWKIGYNHSYYVPEDWVGQVMWNKTVIYGWQFKSNRPSITSDPGSIIQT